MVGNSNGYRAHEGAMAAPQASPSTSSIDDEVERLKLEIREVKAMIWDGKLKLAAAHDPDELSLLRDEQRWLFDETRKLRDEVRLRLEARNIQMQQQHQLLSRCMESSPPVNNVNFPPTPPAAVAPPPSNNNNNSGSCLSGGFGKVAMLQRPALDSSGWLSSDFVHGWHPQQPMQHELQQQQQQQRDCRTQQQQQQQQRVRESDTAVDWTCYVQPPPPPPPPPQPEQQQMMNPPQMKARLAPLRPRKDSSGVAALAEPKTDSMPMQPPKSTNTTSGNKRRRNWVKEEQESLASGGATREERGKRPRWKDHWVMQLIQVRGGMQEEFNKPPKQGVDLWRQVYTKLVASCPDFDKEPEACRKKWKMIVTDYKASNNHHNNNNNNNNNEGSNNNNNSSVDRPEKCKWYQMMDEYITIKDIQTSVADPVNCHDNSNPGGLSLEEVEELRKDAMHSSHSSDKLI